MDNIANIFVPTLPYRHIDAAKIVLTTEVSEVFNYLKQSMTNSAVFDTIFQIYLTSSFFRITQQLTIF